MSFELQKLQITKKHVIVENNGLKYSVHFSPTAYKLHRYFMDAM